MAQFQKDPADMSAVDAKMNARFGKKAPAGATNGKVIKTKLKRGMPNMPFGGTP